MPTPADLAQPLPTVGGPLDDPAQVVAQVGQAVTDSPMPAAALTDAFSASPSGLLDHTSLVDVLGNAPALDATASPAVGLVDPSSPVGAALSSDAPRFGLSMDDVLNALAGKAMSSGMLATLLALMSLTLTRAGRLTETVAGVATGVQIWFTNIRLLPCQTAALADRTFTAAVTTLRTAIVPAGAGQGAGVVTTPSRRWPFPDVRLSWPRPPVGQLDWLKNSRLLLQIGMLLGAAYAAFLTVWFATTSKVRAAAWGGTASPHSVRIKQRTSAAVLLSAAVLMGILIWFFTI